MFLVKIYYKRVLIFPIFLKNLMLSILKTLLLLKKSANSLIFYADKKSLDSDNNLMIKPGFTASCSCLYLSPTGCLECDSIRKDIEQASGFTQSTCS